MSLREEYRLRFSRTAHEMFAFAPRFSRTAHEMMHSRAQRKETFGLRARRDKNARGVLEQTEGKYGKIFVGHRSWDKCLQDGCL